MSTLEQPRGRFREVARLKLADAHVQQAIDTSTIRLYRHRQAAWAEVADIEELRQRAHDARMRVIDDLDAHVARFTAALEGRGGHVFRAATAEQAAGYVVDVCRRAGAKLAAKSKSMASEEIRLNDALERAGVKVVETDLGEYLVQLAGEHPVHILAPALEKTAADAAELLSRVEGKPIPAELEPLLQAARRQLREVFLAADVGITGANFGVAETGSVVLVTNEGNGRLVSSLPRVHVAIMGMERLVSDLADLSVVLRLLARSGTGQRLSAYTTLITGPRRPGEQDGPEELHVVILDNGRSRLLGTRYREMLACIRCGACLNVCPVYRKTGGTAYGPVYSGPMGAVLVPLLVGLERAPALPHASSLCGACSDACPVKIPLHELLLELRRDLDEQGVAPLAERLAFALWSYAWSTPLGYRLSTAIARAGQGLAALAGPGRAWAGGRALPRLAPRRYRDRA
ncbi:MAG TPA: LutB/LldF family L-lactate oxidation iron-sulfur protein [Gaiellaceae bacterium]|nr:LutB/LldF family L-lactate oxidation iron-sulfur protein [Gaiellaceae bacterium]